MRNRWLAVGVAAALVSLSGCAVIAVADAALTVGVVVVKTGATVAGAAVDVTAAGVKAALPDDQEERDK